MSDHELRCAVTRYLLSRGAKRSDIRHEHPLDSWSGAGRTDVLVLNEHWIAAIELKGPRDKWTRATEQIRAAGRACDFAALVAHTDIKDQRAFNWPDEWWNEDLGFCRGVAGEWEPTRPLLWPPATSPSRSTWVGGMGRLLRAVEVNYVARALGMAHANRSTSREGCLAWMQERVTLYDLRPMVVSQLRARPLNRWEEAFWQEFDEGGDRA